MTQGFGERGILIPESAVCFHHYNVTTDKLIEDYQTLSTVGCGSKTNEVAEEQSNT